MPVARDPIAGAVVLKGRILGVHVQGALVSRRDFVVTPKRVLSDADLQALRRAMGEAVVAPGEPKYERLRVPWNTLFDRKPGAIVRCADKSDVMAAVAFASERDLLLSVRGGGHDFAGNSVCDGGLMLDLSRMRGVSVDPDARRAQAGGGATWRDMDHATQPFGLATTAGTGSGAGVAGVTLGGGTGHLARRQGLALDNLVAAQVVTAGGELLQASDDENSDLFWAIRGGGGNFGVATSLEYRLHPVGPEVLAGQLFHPFPDAPEVLRFYRDFMAKAPDTLQCYAFLVRVPPMEPFPRAHHGEMALSLLVAWTGDPEEGAEIVRPLRKHGVPFLDGVVRQPYLVLQQAFDEAMGPGKRWYSRAHYLDRLSDEAIDTALDCAREMPGPFSSAYFEPLGGAVNRVAADATAFPHRSAFCGFHVVAGWESGDDEQALTAWTRDFQRAMAPHANGGVYVNLLAHDEGDRVRAAYGKNFDQLVELKRKWDPDNLFQVNQNIAP